jgi:hypothetical protein
MGFHLSLSEHLSSSTLFNRNGSATASVASCSVASSSEMGRHTLGTSGCPSVSWMPLNDLAPSVALGGPFGRAGDAAKWSAPRQLGLETITFDNK